MSAARRGVAIAACALAAAVVPPAHADVAKPPVAHVDEPRAFGHTIGDVLTQRVLLVAQGRDFGDVALPSGGRVDIWLERRPARIETDAHRRRWMVIDYQITNAPRSLMQIALPALVLRTRAGNVLDVPEWPISVGPLSLDGAGMPAMLPDRGAPPIAREPIVWRLGFALAALAATLAAWLGWWMWRTRREAATLPFAQAWRRIEPLGRRRAGTASGNGDADTDALWRTLHRAFDETAGHVVHRRSLPALFARASWLAPLRADIEQFYRRSDARYFGAADVANDSRAEPDAPTLVALARALYRAERTQHR